MNSDHSFLSDILAYLDQGYSVIPLIPNEKRPLIKWEEFQTRQATHEEAAAWWEKTPTANVGIITGGISGLTVIDVDGQVGLASLQANKVPLPRTRVIKTPKGWHLYCLYNALLHTGAGFLPGLDVRNNGGYVVAPPSSIDGIPYRVFRDYPVAAFAEPPEVLLARVHSALNGSTPREYPRWVSAALSQGTPEHERNTMAARLVGYFHSLGLPKDVIREVMSAYAAKCKPPMDAREIRATIESVTRYEGRVLAARIKEPPTFTDKGDVLMYTWEQHGIVVSVGDPEQSREGLHSDLSVESIIPGETGPLYGPAKFNFTSLTTRAQLVKYLDQRVKLDWQTIIEDVARLTVAHVREGEPLLDLASYSKRERPQWLLEPFVLDDQVTILYGDGGVGKSLFAEAIAVTIQDGTDGVLGMHPTEWRKALILDWESSPEDHGERYEAIRVGAGLPEQRLLYLRCELPITEMQAQVKRLIMEEGIGFIVVDSVVAASPDDAETSNTARRFFRALRSFKVPILCISHVTKDRKGADPFGSIFWKNLARNTWLMETEVEDSHLSHISLINKKVNSGPLTPPIGYRLEFTPGQITFRREPPVTLPTEKRPSGFKAWQLIKEELALAPEGMSQAALEEETGLEAPSIRQALKRGKQDGIFRKEGKLWFLSSSTISL